MEHSFKFALALSLMAALAGIVTWTICNNTHKQVVVQAKRNTARIVLTDRQLPRLVIDLDLDRKTCECWEPQPKRRGK